VPDPVPTLTVLAGTNGAGKSSIGGAQLEAARAPFYNPDAETRALMVANPGMTLDEANAAAWRIGKERLEAAIAERHSFNFEIRRSWDSDRGTNQSRHSRRMVPTTHSRIELALGLRGGDFRTVIPSLFIDSSRCLAKIPSRS
jgi:hypothetical protein